MVVQCCVCKKIRIEGVWKAQNTCALQNVDVSHGYCPVCADDAFREVREYHRHNFRGYTPAKVAHS